MVGEIHFETTWLTHESGTKFYELVRFTNPDAKKFTLVKRWGKLAAADGGGECKIETFASQRAMEAASDKTRQSKEGRGYSIASTTQGFHGLSVSYNRAEDFNDAVSKHYSSGGALSEIMVSMGIEDLEPRIEPEDNEVVSEEPTPEPERGETWGSW